MLYFCAKIWKGRRGCGWNATFSCYYYEQKTQGKYNPPNPQSFLLLLGLQEKTQTNTNNRNDNKTKTKQNKENEK